MTEVDIKKEPTEELVIEGQKIEAEKAPVFSDDRGYFTPINFKEGDKRAYVIENHDKKIVRAFHGHKNERKTFYVLKGAFKVVIICMKTGAWKSFNLVDKGNNKLEVPNNAYNGFVSVSHDAQVLIVSSSTFEESKEDDYRIPYDALGKEIWEVEHR